jgi:undecaprenyl-diphosphatase
MDRGVSAWVEAVRTPAGDAAARALTFFGSTPWTLAAVAVMGTWWWRGRRRTLAAFLSAGAAGLAIQAGLRLLVGQWRPDVEAASVPMDLAARYDMAGFTSGHGFRSAFLFGWWGRALWERRAPPLRAGRAWWATAGALGCGLVILAVGATRVYLRRHWVTDVLGAWLVALVVLSLARRERA